MDVEHLWFSNGGLEKCPTATPNSEDVVQTLTLMADKRLYKLVKWCKKLTIIQTHFGNFLFYFSLNGIFYFKNIYF